MGLPRGKLELVTLEAELEKATKPIFEPKLQKLSLGVDQIKAQSLVQLEESLDRINEAIQNPGQFGEASVKVTADVGFLIVAAKQESHFTVGILPILLERKKLILERIRLLRGEDIDALIDSVSDIALKEKIRNEVQIKSEAENIEKEQAVQQRKTEALVRAAVAKQTTSIEKHPVIWVLGVAVVAFGAGFGAYEAILTVSDRHVLSDTQYERYLELKDP